LWGIRTRQEVQGSLGPVRPGVPPARASAPGHRLGAPLKLKKRQQLKDSKKKKKEQPTIIKTTILLLPGSLLGPQWRWRFARTSHSGLRLKEAKPWIDWFLSAALRGVKPKRRGSAEEPLYSPSQGNPSPLKSKKKNNNITAECKCNKAG
jgi:hypothetical protein